jgi:hypothetical protein
MVEATAMVYKVMEEQHKMDSFVPKEPAILKDEIVFPCVAYVTSGFLT